nr:hypothetical protein [Tanacetum cinerariifolium]
MATTIEQQVVLDEAFVPSTQRLRIGRSNFRLPSDIQSKESSLQVIYDVLCRCPFFKAFKMDNNKHIVNLETFRDMLHICPRIPGQSFDELPFEEEIIEFLRFFRHSAQIRTLTDVNINKLFQPWRSFGAVINKCLTGKSSGFDSFRFTKVIIHHFMSKDLSILRRNKVNWPYVRDDMIFSTIKVASARRKRSGSDTSITPPTVIITPTTTFAVTPRLTAVAKGKQPAKAKSPSDPSELGGSGIDEGTGSKPRVPDVPSDDSEELLWNSSDDEDTDAQEKDRDDDEGYEKDESDDEEEDDAEDKDGDETKKDKSFDLIPRTLEDSEDDGNGEEDQGLRISEEERLNKEEKADELYRDVDINQRRGLQLSQDIEDSHVTLTLVNPDGQQESSSVSSQFVTSMLNPTSDAGMKSIFATASSPVAPLQTSTPIMTPSTIATITIISHAPIPPTTIPSKVLQNLPTFDLVFRFEDRLKSLEANFSEYIQTNPFSKAVSNILGIVHQYM